MKHRVAISTFLALAALAQPATAANWLQVLGNEPPDAPAVRLVGFVQPTFTYHDADPMTWPAPTFNGQHQFQNQVGPDFEHTSQLHLLRAPLGIRGVLRPVSDKINYLLAVEFGRNGMTIERDAVISDATMTFNFIPGARIRAGLIKLPAGEEVQTLPQLVYPYVYYSRTVENLMSERPMRAGPVTGSYPAGLRESVPESGASGFRDWGVMVYDWFNHGPWEFAYAAMLSNGSEIESISDSDSRKDLTVRLQAAYVFGGKGPFREDMSVYAWKLDGERAYDGRYYERDRAGLGFKYARGKHRVSGEYMQGEGMIYGGQFPPFASAPYYAIGPDDKAHGWYLEGGWRFLPKWEADLRYEFFDFLSDNKPVQQHFNTWTVGLQHFINKQTRVTFNYEFREQDMAHPEANTNPMQKANLLNIGRNLADRASVQLTWWF